MGWWPEEWDKVDMEGLIFLQPQTPPRGSAYSLSLGSALPGPGSLKLSAPPLEQLFIHAASTALREATRSSHLASNLISTFLLSCLPTLLLPGLLFCIAHLQKPLDLSLSRYPVAFMQAGPFTVGLWGASPLLPLHPHILGICLQDLGHSLTCDSSVLLPGPGHSWTQLGFPDPPLWAQGCSHGH